MRCSRRCPQPPLSPAKVQEIVRILSRHRPTPPHELMRWRLRLYCGHAVEKCSRFRNTTLHSAFTGSLSCDQCGLDPATIVDGEAIGRVEEPPDATRDVPAAQTRRSARLQKPKRAELETMVRELEAEIERLRIT